MKIQGFQRLFPYPDGQQYRQNYAGGAAEEGLRELSIHTTLQLARSLWEMINVDNTDLFPERLQKLRERRRMSRKTLAERCGLSKNMIGRYERGERKPNIDTLTEICDIFEVSADYILGRKNFF